MRCFLSSSNKGFSAVESLVALGLIIISVGSTYATLTTATGLMNRKQSHDILSNIRTSIIGSINSSGGWKNTVASNPGVMACLQPTATFGCGAAIYSVPREFLVEYATGNLASSGYNINNRGFDRQGQICNYLTNPQCVYRFRVFWSATCDNPACLFPLISITGQLEVKPNSTGVVADPGRYSFQFVRGFVQNNAKDQCDQLNGTFNPTTSICTLQGNGVTCPSGQVVVGVANSQGLVQCQPMFVSFSCPPNHYIKGVTPSATPVCAPLGTACAPTYPSGYSDAFPSSDGDGGGGDCGGDSGDCGN